MLTIGRILESDMNLAKLSTAFSEGQLNSLTADELSRLIKALYQDSSHRTRFLQLLSSATGTESTKSDGLRFQSIAEKAVNASGRIANVAGRIGRIASSATEHIVQSVARS